jgi:hypothetical protein
MFIIADIIEIKKYLAKQKRERKKKCEPNANLLAGGSLCVIVADYFLIGFLIVEVLFFPQALLPDKQLEVLLGPFAYLQVLLAGQCLTCSLPVLLLAEIVIVVPFKILLVYYV